MALLAFAPPADAIPVDSVFPVLLEYSCSGFTRTVDTAKYDYTYDYTYHVVRNPPGDFLQMRS